MRNTFLLSIAFCCSTLTSCEQSEFFTAANSVSAEQGILASENAARHLYALDAESSVVEWWGRGPGNEHHGAFNVQAENIEVVNGKVKEGNFVIPIATIQNFDLEEHIRPVLLNHLKSADFFNMIRYPEASFSFQKMTPLTKAAEGAVAGANCMVTGEFTMLGESNTISFPARVYTGGGQLSIEATLTIDRTEWGMTYAADPAHGDHQIYPEVDLHLKLKGQKQ